MTLDARNMDRIPNELSFMNLMNLFDDVTTLTQDPSTNVACAIYNGNNQGMPMSHMLAKEISFTPDIASHVELD